MKEIEGKVVTLKLKDLLRSLIDDKSPTFEIDGITLVFQDYHLIEEKDVKPIGTGFHVTLSVGIGEEYQTVYVIPGNEKEVTT